MWAPNGVAMEMNVRRSPFMVRSTVPKSGQYSNASSLSAAKHIPSETEHAKPLGRSTIPKSSRDLSASSSSSARHVPSDVATTKPPATIPRSWISLPQKQQDFIDAMDSTRHEVLAPPHRTIQRSASVGSISPGSMHPQDSVQRVLQRTFSAEVLSPRHHARSSTEGSRSAPTPSKDVRTSCADSKTAQADSDIMLQLAALYMEMQSLSDKTNTVANQLEDCRAELRRYSDQLCSNLEERLKTQIVEIQDQLNAKTQVNRIEQSPLFSRSGNVKLDDTALSLNLAVCAGVPPSRHTNLVKDISDHVIARVNADPHICQLVENHQSIQENFTKLLGLVGSGPAIGQGDQTDSLALYDTMIETQTTCKSVASELHQLQQRRNQDTYEAAIKFADLERKLQAIESSLTSESALKLCVSSSDGFSNLSELFEAHAEQDAKTPVAMRGEASGRKSAGSCVSDVAT